MIVHGFDVYKTYLAFKQHFSNPSFDFFEYDGKVKAKESTYHDRKDYYFFETLARKLTDQEVKEYMLASFVAAENPSKVWIGDIKRTGKDRWLDWQKQQATLGYTVEQDLNAVAQHMETKGHTFNNLFEAVGGHPPLLRCYIRREISLDTLIVMDIVLGFSKRWDTQLRDPLWEQLSFKIKKYKPFLSIPSNKYKEMMRQRFQ